MHLRHCTVSQVYEQPVIFANRQPAMRKVLSMFFTNLLTVEYQPI